MVMCTSLGQVAEIIGDGGPHAPDRTFDTVGELVDALVNLGNTDEVIAFHDDHLGLKDNLPDAFLKAPLHSVDDDEFASEIDAVLEQANTIFPLADRELSEDDQDDIDEDRRSRGTGASD